MTAQGHPRLQFRRAIASGNVVIAELTAREFALNLDEGLEFLAVDRIARAMHPDLRRAAQTSSAPTRHEREGSRLCRGNLDSMSDGDPTPSPGRPSLIERRARRIANARSATLGLALTFLGLALVGAVVIRIADQDNFPSLGLALWWALQTVTTVGYGDVVPTTTFGRVVGGAEMVIGISFIAFLTAGVTSVVIQRGQAGADEDEHAQRERNTQAVLDALTETQHAITGLDRRLNGIEAKLPN